MEFRPCIDIHNGCVKQIIGGSLRDSGDHADANYISELDGAYYAVLFKAKGLKGGHVILLNSVDSEYYKATKEQALSALRAYPQGLQVGGGINPSNAGEFLEAGASHVIVTSYVFKDGRIHYDRLQEMVEAVGKDHLVLDVSCRKTMDGYMVVTDRWQKLTEEKVTTELLDRLSEYCDEFLVHAVDVEGRNRGIETELATLLGQWNGVPVTYAGGVHGLGDIDLLREVGAGRLNVTIGSALDIYGGHLNMADVIARVREE